VDVNTITVIALLFGILCVVATVYLEVNRRRRSISLQERGLPPEATGVSSPLLAGVAIVALAVAFYTSNRVDRSPRTANISESAKCEGATFSAPREAVAGENVLVTVANVNEECKKATGDFTLSINGKALPEVVFSQRFDRMSDRPPANPPSQNYSYEAWFSIASPGPSTIELTIPNHHPSLTPVSIGTSHKNPNPPLARHRKVVTILKPDKGHILCTYTLSYPDAVLPKGYAVLEVSADPANKPDCGVLVDAQLLDEKEQPIPSMGTFFDERGSYVQWYIEIGAPTTLWLELSGVSPSGGAELPLLIRTKQSFSGIANYAKDILAALTALLGVLVTVVGYLRGAAPQLTK
jgi:hypothetical protein